MTTASDYNKKVLDHSKMIASALEENIEKIKNILALDSLQTFHNNLNKESNVDFNFNRFYAMFKDMLDSSLTGKILMKKINQKFGKYSTPSNPATLPIVVNSIKPQDEILR